jgi:hypothetical protein
MILGKESVQVSELFVVHGHRASAAIVKNIPQPVDLEATFDPLGYPPGGEVGWSSPPGRTDIGGSRFRPLTIC